MIEALLDYRALVLKWSRAYNLVSEGDLEHLLVRHFLDSIAIRPWVRGTRLLDVGTGAGFPGLPLAIADPRLDVTLLDADGKKVRFLRHVVRRLALSRAHPVQARVESFSTVTEFSTITSRALGTLKTFAESVRHLAGPETRLLAMKGRRPDRELGNLPQWVNVETVAALAVPGTNADRHLVMMTLSV